MKGGRGPTQYSFGVESKLFSQASGWLLTPILLLHASFHFFKTSGHKVLHLSIFIFIFIYLCWLLWWWWWWYASTAIWPTSLFWRDTPTPPIRPLSLSLSLSLSQCTKILFLKGKVNIRKKIILFKIWSLHCILHSFHKIN